MVIADLQLRATLSLQSNRDPLAPLQPALRPKIARLHVTHSVNRADQAPYRVASAVSAARQDPAVLVAADAVLYRAKREGARPRGARSWAGEQ